MTRLLPLVLGTLLISLLLAACGGSSEPSTADVSSPPVIEIPARWASADASSIDVLSNASDMVILGRVTRLASQQNEALAPNSAPAVPVPGKPARESTGTTIPISTFEVTVTDVLSGSAAAGDTVTVEQLGGVIADADGKPALIVLENDKRIEIGTTYLFFLKRGTDGTLTSAPFGRFVLSDTGFAAMPAWQSTGAASEIARSSAAEVKEKVSAE